MLKRAAAEPQLDHIPQERAAQILRDLRHGAERSLRPGEEVMQILHARPSRRFFVGVDVVPAVERRVIHHTAAGVDALGGKVGAVPADLLVIVKLRVPPVSPAVCV